MAGQQFGNGQDRNENHGKQANDGQRFIDAGGFPNQSIQRRNHLIPSWRGSKSVGVLTEVVAEIVVPDIAKRIRQDEKNGYTVPFEPNLTAQLI